MKTCPASVYTALFANSALNLNDAAAVVNTLACVYSLTILNVCPVSAVVLANSNPSASFEPTGTVTPSADIVIWPETSEDIVAPPISTVSLSRYKFLNLLQDMKMSQKMIILKKL